MTRIRLVQEVGFVYKEWNNSTRRISALLADLLVSCELNLVIEQRGVLEESNTDTKVVRFIRLVQRSKYYEFDREDQLENAELVSKFTESRLNVANANLTMQILTDYAEYASKKRRTRKERERIFLSVATNLRLLEEIDRQAEVRGYTLNNTFYKSISE